MEGARTSGRNSASSTPALRLVDVDLGRHDVEVAGQDDGPLELHQLGGVRRQALEPAQLVVELRAGRRVAVRQVQAADQHAADVGFDVAAVHVLRIAGQAAARLHGLSAAAQDGDAVPALLAVPDRA